MNCLQLCLLEPHLAFSVLVCSVLGAKESEPESSKEPMDDYFLPPEAMADFVKARLLELCEDANDLTGTCQIRGTALRLPVITRVINGTTKPERRLPEGYEIKASLVDYGCGETSVSDCDFMQKCIPHVPTSAAPWPYECHCVEPFLPKGRIGNKDICYDVCMPNPCGNNGSCGLRLSEPGHFHCNCTDGFQGQTCADKVCDPEFCNFHGNCTFLNQTTIMCQCEQFFSGSSCDRNIAVSVAIYLAISLATVVAFIAVGAFWFRNTNRKPRDWWPFLDPSPNKIKSK